MDNQPNQSQPPASTNTNSTPLSAPTPPSTYPTPTSSSPNAPIQTNSYQPFPGADTGQSKSNPRNLLVPIVLLVLVAGLAVVMYSQLKPSRHQTASSNSTAAAGYTTHTVTVGGQTFHLSFDKNATSRAADPNSTLLTGNDFVGHKIIVGLTAIPASMVVTSNPCSPLFAANTATEIGSVTILNTSQPLCGSTPESSSNTIQNAIIGTRFESKSQWYKLALNVYPNATYGVDVNTAKQIADSLSL